MYRNYAKQNSAKVLAMIKRRYDFGKSLEPSRSGKMENKNLAEVLAIASVEIIFRTPLSEHARENGK